MPGILTVPRFKDKPEDIGILLVYGGVNSKLPAVAVYGTEFECITGIGGGS